MAVVCAWCQQPIFIGEPITLYSPKSPDDFEIPEGAVVYSKRSLQMVGCAKMSCTTLGRFDAVGYWDAPGQVYLMPVYPMSQSAEVMAPVVDRYIYQAKKAVG